MNPTAYEVLAALVAAEAVAIDDESRGAASRAHAAARACVARGDVTVPREPTLRDRFAIAALQGMHANGEIDISPSGYAQVAYNQADAMMIARDAATKESAK